MAELMKKRNGISLMDSIHKMCIKNLFCLHAAAERVKGVDGKEKFQGLVN